MARRVFFGINIIPRPPSTSYLHPSFLSSEEGKSPCISSRLRPFLTQSRPTGGATLTEPSNWDNRDLSVYFDRQATFSARSATRVIPTGTTSPSSTGDSKKSNVGAIAGGVVGGLAGLILILLLVLYCLRRHKNSRKSSEEKAQSPPPPLPVELAATSPIQEMPSPGTAKYMSLRQQPDMYAHPLYSGPNSTHSRSPSDDCMHPIPVSPYQPQQYPATSPTIPTYPSPYNTQQPLPSYAQQDHYNYNNQYTNTYDTPNYDAAAYPAPLGTTLQREYSNPMSTSPTSPNFPPAVFPVSQYQNQQQQHQHHYPPQQHQVYYPPPPEPSIRSRSHHSHQSSTSYSDRMTSIEGAQFSGADRHTRSPPSTTTTPAQFYAQPVPVRGPSIMSGGSLAPPSGIGDDAGSINDTGSVRSVDSRKRPVRGRFVEVDDL